MRRALSKTYSAAAQLLLDEYPNAAAAYSLRELSTASVGSAIVRVRRSLDNAEQDFTATEITDGTLTTFTGANDGFVTTWYDQSGNSKNLIQSSTTLQLQIVLSGVLNTQNSLPSLLGSNSLMTLNYDFSGLVSYMSVFSMSGTNKRLFITSGDSSGLRNRLDNNLAARGSVADAVLANNTTTLGQMLITGFGTTSYNGYRNGILQASLDIGLYESSTTFRIGSSFVSNNFTGNLQEAIFYESDESANRTAIETNINDHYNIYP